MFILESRLSTMFRWSIVQSRRQDNSDDQNCAQSKNMSIIMEYRINKSDQKLEGTKKP